MVLWLKTEPRCLKACPEPVEGPVLSLSKPALSVVEVERSPWKIPE